MRRRSLLWAAVGCCLPLLTLFDASMIARSASAAPGSWSTPLALVAPSESARPPQLRVASNGEAIVGWLGGEAPSPVVVPPVAAPRARRPSTSAWKGQTIVVDRGSLQGGFQEPVVVAGPIHEYVRLSVALATSGIAYVVWSSTSRGPTTISTAPRGRAFSAPRQLLPAGAKLLALLQSTKGRVAAVWSNDEISSVPWPVLHYALLRPDGRLGHVVTLGRFGVPLFGEHFVLNDRGEFAVVGVTDNGGGYGGHWPPRPVIDVCDAAERCSGPRAMAVGPIGRGETQVEDSLALSGDGTLTVFASAGSVGCHPRSSQCGGTWAVVRTPSGRWLAARELSRVVVGGGDIAGIVDGPRSSLAVYGFKQNGSSYYWSALEADGARVTHAAIVDGPTGYKPQGEPVLSADSAGSSRSRGVRSPTLKSNSSWRRRVTEWLSRLDILTTSNPSS